ncbi:ABC transporter substrate-binding protein [Halolamina litorea]|uniref:ABC transporter substrate-binding protein n=1 Tax=Halolamina litorea TaxID=1515593 RepID=A0ABD6BQ10_9EURY|nr:ABC transporter substrate-binding protein [Halolamina litorea]
MVDDSPDPQQLIDRRSILRYSVVGGAIGLAGCTGGGDGDGTDSATDEPSSTAEGTPLSTEEDVQTGGRPVVGLGAEPQAFNPLVTSDADAWAIMDRLYPYPTVRDPADVDNTHPYVFNDWSFDPDSLTGEVTLTEGFQWSDGEPLNAEGVAWWFQYLMDNSGHRYESNTNQIASIEATGEYELSFELEASTAAVFTPETGVFAVPLLPAHVWQEVDDYTQYSPDELIGAQGFEWSDSSPGNWYELNSNPDLMPDEIHEGPYVDGLRFRVFGDMTTLVEELRQGNVDLTYNSIAPNRAFQLQDADSAKVWNSRARGYNYIAHNMRRTPFDDKPFRQSLGFIYPFNYLQSQLRRGMTETGDYVAAKVYDPWRPDSFDSPIQHGPYMTEDGQLDVERAREFLENADGEHDYTFGSVESPQVTGDQEIRVDGELLTEAHTNNAGDAGQGPISLVITPPSTAPVEAQAGARFVENLNEVGIPAETEPVAEGSQNSLIWGQEDFDMWSSGWIWMPKPHMYMGFWLTSSSVDADSSSDNVNLNPMGYTNADDLISAVQTTYEPEEQQQATKEALAQVYEDQPVLVTEYPNRLHASSNAYTGWVKLPGGITQNPWTYLNVRQA